MADLSTIPVTIGADILDVLIEMAQPRTEIHKFFLNRAIDARSEATINAEASLVEAERINESLFTHSNKEA